MIGKNRLEAISLCSVTCFYLAALVPKEEIRDLGGLFVKILQIEELYFKTWVQDLIPAIGVRSFSSKAVEALKREVERLTQEKIASERKVRQREREAREGHLKEAEASTVETSQKEAEVMEVHLKESKGKRVLFLRPLSRRNMMFKMRSL
ncbi:hypothetical protein Ancab_038073 [Ancistrocladus abbreviatus]